MVAHRELEFFSYKLLAVLQTVFSRFPLITKQAKKHRISHHDPPSLVSRRGVVFD